LQALSLLEVYESIPVIRLQRQRPLKFDDCLGNPAFGKESVA
jgi:hypothetical protein